MTTPTNDQEVTEYNNEEIVDELGDLDSEIDRLDVAADVATSEVLAAEEGGVEEAEDVSPSAPVPATADETTQLREENTRLNREANQQRQLAEENHVRQAAAQFAQEQMTAYIAQGHDDQTARQLAIADAKVAVAEHRSNNLQLDSDRNEVSRIYGVPKEQLMSFNDRASMQNFGTQYQQTTGPQAKRVQDLEKKVAALTRVPSQSFNQPGQPRGATTLQQDLDRYIAGARDDRANAAGKRAAGRG